MFLGNGLLTTISYLLCKACNAFLFLQTFQRIKTNRQGRLRIKIRKRKGDDNCPICIGRMHRTPEEMNAHVEQCSRKVIHRYSIKRRLQLRRFFGMYVLLHGTRVICTAKQIRFQNLSLSRTIYRKNVIINLLIDKPN